MSVAAGLLAALRRMVAEPTSATYSDQALSAFIEAYPVIDAKHRDPADDEWEATYDLNAAAQDIWSEKASALAGGFDFSADGGQYSRSQQYQQAMAQARYYGARRKAASKRIVKSPKEREAPYANYLDPPVV